MYGHRLLYQVRRPVAIFALVTLIVAQLAAGSHAARHLRYGGDGSDVPGVHTQICLECASFAPLASAVGGAVTALAVAALGVEELFLIAPERPLPAQRRVAAFRSRAPPR